MRFGDANELGSPFHKRLVMEKRWVARFALLDLPCRIQFVTQCLCQYLYLSLFRTMGTIAEGVEFDTIAREVRCKWSEDNDKASLAKAQAELNKILGDLKAIDGAKSVQRIVCGK